MPLLQASKTYKPFEYPWAFEYWKRQQQIHWMPEEVPLGEDCRDWAQKLDQTERNLLTQIFRFFTQADVEVQDCYHDKYGRVFKPTEIKMMLTAFSNMETVHIAAYSHLLDTIDFKGRVGGEAAAAAIVAVMQRWTNARRSALQGRAGDRSGWLARRTETLSGWRARASEDGK